MFKPLTAPHTKDKKGRQQQVRSTFGSIELDKDAIKYYAENNFSLAKTLFFSKDSKSRSTPASNAWRNLQRDMG
jgi:hypothetical protein